MYNTKSDFITQLHKDIATQNELYIDPKKFIKHKNLQKIKLNNQRNLISETDFPIEASLGSIYLIKGVNILGMYCWYDNKYSLYLQINKSEPKWICKTEIYNKSVGDPEKLDYYIDGMDVIFSSDICQYLMLQFIQSGFDMYV
jgi:hypothetical protein